MDERFLLSQLRHDSTREEAFTSLIRQYQEPLYWQIRRMVLHHDDADDVLQNTFVKAWTGIDSFRGECKISTWLYRIAINETLSFLDKKKKTPSGCDADITVADTLIGDIYFDGDRTQAQLQEAVAQLPEKQRLVFNMKYFQEMTYEDISEILGTSVGALKASYHIAVKKITSFFDKND